MIWRRLTLAVAVAIVWRLDARVTAHDLPTDVAVQTFVKPEGQRLHVVVRVPLAAMLDVDYPTRGPAGLLDLTRIQPALDAAVRLWLIPGITILENGSALRTPRLTSTAISLPSDRSFASYDAALAHLAGDPLSPDVELYWNQAMLDAHLEYDIASDRSAFALRPAFARLGVHVTTVVRFLPAGGDARVFDVTGDPGLIQVDPNWHQSALRFLQVGFTRALDGTEPLLFLVCLVIPLRGLRAIVPVAIAFAAGHSITIFAAHSFITPAALWFRPLVDLLMAASIVYVAVENMLASQFDHRWAVAFASGLVHGFGLSAAMTQSLQFAGTHTAAALGAFSIGVDLGQVLLLAIVIPPIAIVARSARSERIATIVLSAVAGHTAWHWMVDRGSTLRRFRVQWPVLDAAFAANAVSWLVLAVLAGATWWLLSRLAGRIQRNAPAN